MQLYSLAGITVSLNLVIDSTIVMTDHILHRRNLKAFLSVLAATLTTMGALVIIFFLDEKIRLNLQDFAAVVIINLAVSLMVALFFVPSMIEKIGLVRRITGKKRRLVLPGLTQTFKTRLGRIFRRFPILFLLLLLSALIRFLCRWRWAVYLLLLLGFRSARFSVARQTGRRGNGKLYNKVFGSDTYKESVKPIVDKALGGSLRLFIQKVYEGSYFTHVMREVVLYANANLPNGSTLEQMNTLMKRMETYLSRFKEIRQFHTSIYSPGVPVCRFIFKKEVRNSGFPIH